MKEENYRDFFCGYGAAVTSVCITYPLSKIIFRQMLHGVEIKHAVDQLRKEGILSLYRGLLPPLLQKSASMAVMFGTFNQIYRHLCQATPNANKIVHYSFIWPSAAVSAAFECILIPLERIQTLLQDSKYHDRFQNTFHAAKELQKYSFREYYRGFTAIYFRNTMSTALFFSLRDPIAIGVLAVLHRQRLEVHHGDHPSAAELFPQGLAHFTSGAILGAGLSTIFYPMNVIRARMQSYVGGPFYNAFEMWKIIYNERKSVLAMWRGVPLNFSRSIFSWGIINASYELLKIVIFQQSD